MTDTERFLSAVKTLQMIRDVPVQGGFNLTTAGWMQRLAGEALANIQHEDIEIEMIAIRDYAANRAAHVIRGTLNLSNMGLTQQAENDFARIIREEITSAIYVSEKERVP